MADETCRRFPLFRSVSPSLVIVLGWLCFTSGVDIYTGDRFQSSAWLSNFHQDILSLLHNPSRPGHVIYFSTRTAIYSVSQGGSAHLVIGGNSTGYYNATNEAPLFSYIHDLEWLDDEHMDILLVDSLNHCVRLLAVAEETVQDFAGRCQEPGMASGHVIEQSQFNSPKSLATVELTDGSRRIFVGDPQNSRLCSINTQTNMLTAFLSHFHSVADLMTDPQQPGIMYVTTTRMIWCFDIEQDEKIDLAGDWINNYYNRDGIFDLVNFNNLISTDWINSRFVVTVDEGSKLMQLADFSSQTISSILLDLDAVTQLRRVIGIKNGSVLVAVDNHIVQLEFQPVSTEDRRTGDLLSGHYRCNRPGCPNSEDSPTFTISRPECSMVCLQSEGCIGYEHYNNTCRFVHKADFRVRARPTCCIKTHHD